MKNKIVDEYPSISIVIPTLNSGGVLESCLKSILEQNYPKDKIEIIVADGGSTDNTLLIAKDFNVEILPNPLKTGESGKAAGIKIARNEIIALIDSDNVLDRKDWLKRMVEPFKDEEIAGCEPLYYTYNKQDGYITRYCALLGMNDPLCLFLGNYDRYCSITGKWTEAEVEEEEKDGYLKVRLNERRLPTIGANGFLVRKALLEKCAIGTDYLFDIDAVYGLVKRGYDTFAKAKVGITHLFCASIDEFARKQRRRIRDYAYYKRLNLRKYPWGSSSKLKLLKFILYTLLVFPLLAQAMRGYLRKKDRAWLFHVSACWITLSVYAYEALVQNIFGVKPEDRSRWGGRGENQLPKDSKVGCLYEPIHRRYEQRGLMNNKFAKYDQIRFLFCSFVPVGLEDYVEYFKNYFGDFTYLRWKFHYVKSNSLYSCVQYFLDGKLLRERKLFSFPKIKSRVLYFLFLPFNYMVYFVQFFKNFAVKKTKGKINVLMGINYFCTFCGIILKKLRKIDFVIYRVMDFFPLPPKGIYRQLNSVFYFLDKICLEHNDAIWFTTEGHIRGREKYGYFDRNKYYYEMVPLAINLSKFTQKSVTTVDRYSLVYCGNISRYHMLELLFEVIGNLRKVFPEVKLNIVGSGQDEDYFRKLSIDMNLQENVVFHGFIEEGERFSDVISNNCLGIALYKDDENFIKYTEPAKVKTYLSFGVPVVVSKVPDIAEEIQCLKVGFAVRNNRDEIVAIISEYFNDRRMQALYRKNVREYVKTLDVNQLLQITFEKTFGRWGLI